MRNRLWPIAILAGMLSEVCGANAAQAPATAPAKEKLHPAVEKMLRDVDARAEKIKDLQADLVRTKISYAWGDKVTRKGVLKYRRPSLWYADLGTGKHREIWVGTGKGVYQVKFRLKQVIEHPVSKEQQQDALRHGPIAFLLGQKAEQTRRRYRLELVKDDDKHTTVRAIPRPGVRVGFTKAELTVAKKTALPVRVHMWERTRDQLIFEFRKVRENTDLAVGQFHKPGVPSGWRFLKAPARPQAPQ